MGTADWYARRLQQPAPPPPTNLPQAPLPQPQQAPAPPPPGAEPESLSDALANPYTTSRGGQAAKTEHGSCPECGSTNFFSRSNTDGGKPRCYDCGYPVVQFGSPTGDGGLMQSVKGGQQ